MCKHCNLPICVSTWEPKLCIFAKDGKEECDGEFHHNCLQEHDHIYHEEAHIAGEDVGDGEDLRSLVDLFKITEEDEYEPVGMMAVASGVTVDTALPKAKAKAKASSSISSEEPTVKIEDEWEMTDEANYTLLKYGPHKGKTYINVMTNHPEYVMDQRKEFSDKKMPKYISDFLAWADRTGGGPSKNWEAKQKQRRKLEKLEFPCENGCIEFSRAGSNHIVEVKTCVVCGHGEKTRLKETPVFDPETCPHDVTDRRGSTKDHIIVYCRQCCTHIDCKS